MGVATVVIGHVEAAMAEVVEVEEGEVVEEEEKGEVVEEEGEGEVVEEEEEEEGGDNFAWKKGIENLGNYFGTGYWSTIGLLDWWEKSFCSVVVWADGRHRLTFHRSILPYVSSFFLA